jgi:microcompartment protein CcmK/EutM
VSIGVHPWFEFMLLARVEGNVVATRKHPSFEGWRLVICQPISQSGEPEGAPQVAIDPHGAGMHQRVVISSDGFAARNAVGDQKSPARWMVIGVVDEKDAGVPA